MSVEPRLRAWSIPAAGPIERLIVVCIELYPLIYDGSLATLTDLAAAGGMSRRTIRKHLGEAVSRSVVERVGTGYRLAECPPLEEINRRRQRRGARSADEYCAALRFDPCAYCSAPGEHLDHVDPRARGGRDHWDNLASACSACNLRKSAMTLLGFLLSVRYREATSRAAGVGA